jgi:integrase
VTPDQLRRFLAVARTEQLYAMWLMFATTGMRRSEAAGAKRALLDLGQRTIMVWDTRVVAGRQVAELSASARPAHGGGAGRSPGDARRGTPAPRRRL